MEDSDRREERERERDLEILRSFDSVDALVKFSRPSQLGDLLFGLFPLTSPVPRTSPVVSEITVASLDFIGIN